MSRRRLPDAQRAVGAPLDCGLSRRGGGSGLLMGAVVVSGDPFFIEDSSLPAPLATRCDARAIPFLRDLPFSASWWSISVAVEHRCVTVSPARASGLLRVPILFNVPRPITAVSLVIAALACIIEQRGPRAIITPLVQRAAPSSSLPRPAVVGRQRGGQVFFKREGPGSLTAAAWAALSLRAPVALPVFSQRPPLRLILFIAFLLLDQEGVAAPGAAAFTMMGPIGGVGVKAVFGHVREVLPRGSLEGVWTPSAGSAAPSERLAASTARRRAVAAAPLTSL